MSNSAPNLLNENASDLASRAQAARGKPTASLTSAPLPDERPSIRTAQQVRTVVLIHPSRLVRDCLSKALVEGMNCSVIAIADVAQAVGRFTPEDVALFLICLPDGSKTSDKKHVDGLISEIDRRSPIVVVGDSEDPDFVVSILSKGVPGYLPTSLDLSVAVQVFALVGAGGTYAPASCLLNVKRTASFDTEPASDLDLLTAKQLDVLEFMRKGKSNKAIAYDLSMCESTVKVHVRNIMKKLHARNRTQVAYIANQMLQGAYKGA